MSYIKHDFKSGEKLYAQQLNEMDEQILKNEEEVSKLSEDIATKASAIKEKASGELIVVTDSDEAKPLELAIDGKSEQNQYSGKNLIPYPYPKTTDSSEGIVFTVLDNGAIKYKGTSTGYATFAICNDWKPNKGTYKKNVGEKCNFVVSRIIRSSSSYDSLMANYAATEFSTTNWDFETYKYAILLQVIPSHGAVDNVFYPMICPSTETDMETYEPYCGGKPSPSPEYKQEIRNIGVYDEASGKYAVEVKCTTEDGSKETTATVLLDEPLREGDKAYWNGEKMFVERKRAVIESYNGENINTDYLSTTGSLDNGALVEYQLATPITEEIDIDLGELSMFYPTTILSNDCNANMEVTYAADTKAYIDKKFAELATAMV